MTRYIAVHWVELGGEEETGVTQFESPRWNSGAKWVEMARNDSGGFLSGFFLVFSLSSWRLRLQHLSTASKKPPLIHELLVTMPNGVFCNTA